MLLLYCLRDTGIKLLNVDPNVKPFFLFQASSVTKLSILKTQTLQMFLQRQNKLFET